MLLLDLPFKLATFKKVVQELLINISIIRALNRGAPIFRRTKFTHPDHKGELLCKSIDWAIKEEEQF